MCARDEAEKLGLRKLPPAERDELRLIEVADFDLSACGGTHVNATGQIGSILLRKTEKTRQGMRVEFVCGGRAVAAARRDYSTLSEAASFIFGEARDVPEMIRKTFEEIKELRRAKGRASSTASVGRSFGRSEAELGGLSAVIARNCYARVFRSRRSLRQTLCQKATRAGSGVVALVASTMNPPGVVFAQTPGGTADMGSCCKQAWPQLAAAAEAAAISPRADCRQAARSKSFCAKGRENWVIVPAN